MLKLLCVLYTVGLYLAVAITVIKDRHYFFTLLRRSHSHTYSDSLHGCISTQVAPMYRETYFGYEYFVLPEFDNSVLRPDNKMRTYGVVHPYRECLLNVKDNKVKTIIALEEKQFGEYIEKNFALLYRNILLIITGGFILCKICLWYMT